MTCFLRNQLPLRTHPTPGQLIPLLIAIAALFMMACGSLMPN